MVRHDHFENARCENFDFCTVSKGIGCGYNVYSNYTH